jgi:hypothetical protein
MKKLSTKFPQSDPKKWLKFATVAAGNIHPVFAGRMAALAESMGQIITITPAGGKRETKKQEQLYVKSGGKKNSKGEWYGGNGYAAKPGYSNHEYGVALDVADAWLKKIEQDAHTDRQYILRAFGLYKPLTKGNKTSVCENWHIQPIEIRGITDIAKKKEYLNDYMKG